MASASAWFTGGQIVAKALDLVTLLALLYFLTPADFGLVAQALTVVVIVEAITMVPIQHPILRIPQPRRTVYDTAFTLTLMRALLIAGAVALAADPIAAYFREPDLPPLLYALALAPMVRGCLSPRLAEYDRRFDMRPYVVMEVAAKALALAVAVSIAWSTASYWAIAAATITTPIVLSTLSFVFAPYRPRFSLADFESFRDIVGWNTAAQAIETIAWQLDRLLLGRALPNDVFGRYAASRQVTEIPEQSVSRPVGRPMLAAFAQAKGSERLGELWSKFSNTMLFIVGPLLVGVAFLARHIEHALFGPGWDGADVFIFGLALATLPALPWLPLRSLSVAVFQTRLHTLRVFVKLIISVPVLWLAIQWYGAVGAIIAKAVIEIAMIPVAALLVRHLVRVGVGQQMLALWRSAAGLVAMAAVLTGFNVLRPPAPGADRILVAIESGIAFGLAGLGYLVLVFALWRLAGRPSGIEGLILDRASMAAGLLGRRLLKAT